jgi:hypothetical protein
LFVQPFLSAEHWLLALFPFSHWYGVMLPVVLLIVGISLALTFVGTVMMMSRKKQQPAGGGKPAGAKKTE